MQNSIWFFGDSFTWGWGCTPEHEYYKYKQEGDQIWTIEIETDDGNLTLLDGGARMVINDVETTSDHILLNGEYPRLYAKFAELINGGQSEMDLTPLQHVADAFLLGRRMTTEPFIEN
ncbi:MAG: hypothetical protein EBT51_10025 [Flavobacteriaceae bacterium]|nr:hypothetical protein [Flavobacteriaceae bacterium]